MAVCWLALYHQLAYVTTQMPISLSHQPMYSVNYSVTSAQASNVFMKHVIVLLHEVAMGDSGGNPKGTSNDSANTRKAYMVKRKCVSKKPTKEELLSENSHKEEGYETSGTFSNGKNLAIFDNDRFAKQKG
ncbi:13481_t:CDS:2 [Cetraspora pellucida]|uniref:13481_t:CDS:1 n=1 Tax=Cetraspora pellucida TaxID=1433469 RepID=A0ACA9LRK3_9GLOM|nr:13481_t:CDS:2 [Cetraspora pellucida]